MSNNGVAWPKSCQFLRATKSAGEYNLKNDEKENFRRIAQAESVLRSFWYWNSRFNTFFIFLVITFGNTLYFINYFFENFSSFIYNVKFWLIIRFDTYWYSNGNKQMTAPASGGEMCIERYRSLNAILSDEKGALEIWKSWQNICLRLSNVNSF